MATASFAATTDPALVIGGCAGGERARSVAFQLTGTFTGTITFESTVDGENWVATGAFPISGSATAATTATTTGIWRIRLAGLVAVRASCTAFSSGPIVVTAETTDGIF